VTPVSDAPLNIEQPEELLRHLRERGHVGADESPAITVLRGGVSNRTVLVERTGGESFVLKQALPKLRVQVNWECDPRRAHREALALRVLERFAPAGAITPLRFEDEEHHLLAMAAVPPPHENWKTLLLAGQVDLDHARQFGELLGRVHRESARHLVELPEDLRDRSFYEALRIEPYYAFTASRNPVAALFYSTLIAETRTQQVALVHGDFSPKNILVHRERLVLLDHEVAHIGDPAFDVGFALTHLLSKALHLPAQREALLGAADIFCETWRQAAGQVAAVTDINSRAARHTLGCLLARVDGRSPLEYLSPTERDQQRAVALALMLMQRPPGDVSELVRQFGGVLKAYE
jgi:tRNA A-37 threonylcarbamoyl transferase component Bud32